MYYLRFSALCGLLLISTTASALTGYWYAGTNYTIIYSSSSAACSAINTTGGSFVGAVSNGTTTATSRQCVYNVSGTNVLGGYIYEAPVPSDVLPTQEQKDYCAAQSGNSSYFKSDSPMSTTFCGSIPGDTSGGSCSYTMTYAGTGPDGKWYTKGTASGTACNISTAGVTTTKYDSTPVDQPKETTTATTTDTTTATAPDGTKTDTTTTTTTTTTQGGITTTDTSTIVTESGATVEKEVKTTTITNPDGSKTVTTETTYTQLTQGQTTITPTGQTYQAPSVKDTGTTTQTDTYSPTGEQTSSYTYNYNGGAAQVQQQAEEKPQNTCGGPDQPKCQMEFDDGDGCGPVTPQAVCDFFDWFKSTTALPEQPGVPTKTIETPAYDSGLPFDGMCPAPYIINLGIAGTHEIKIDYLCQFAAGIRVFVITMAYLMGMFIVIGRGK